MRALECSLKCSLAGSLECSLLKALTRLLNLRKLRVTIFRTCGCLVRMNGCGLRDFVDNLQVSLEGLERKLVPPVFSKPESSALVFALE